LLQPEGLLEGEDAFKQVDADVLFFQHLAFLQFRTPGAPRESS
jgi:hypothetical protein